MNVLVCFERSGAVRDAFRALGHDAWSIDAEACESFGRWHQRADLLEFLLTRQGRARLAQGRDLIILHPPCTRLALSGAWVSSVKYYRRRGLPESQARAYLYEQEQALATFRACVALGEEHPRLRVAVENPMSVASKHVRRPTQQIQPWQFGHPETKTTCLWLHNLPPLRPTTVLYGRHNRTSNLTASGQNRLSPSPTRAMDRARTYHGVAVAMAEQWGALGADQRFGRATFDL